MIEILGKREIGFVYLFVEMLLGVLVCIDFTMSLSKSLMWHVFILSPISFSYSSSSFFFFLFPYLSVIPLSFLPLLSSSFSYGKNPEAPS